MYIMRDIQNVIHIPADKWRNSNVIITPNEIATPFSHNNDLIITLCAHRGCRCTEPRHHTTMIFMSNNLNPIQGVATICHQVRCMRWGHPSLFDAATSLLNWYKMACTANILHRHIWAKFMNMLCSSSAVAARGKYPGFMLFHVKLLIYSCILPKHS